MHRVVVVHAGADFVAHENPQRNGQSESIVDSYAVGDALAVAIDDAVGFGRADHVDVAHSDGERRVVAQSVRQPEPVADDHPRLNPLAEPERDADGIRSGHGHGDGLSVGFAEPLSDALNDAIAEPLRITVAFSGGDAERQCFSGAISHVLPDAVGLAGWNGEWIRDVHPELGGLALANEQPRRIAVPERIALWDAICDAHAEPLQDAVDVALRDTLAVAQPHCQPHADCVTDAVGQLVFQRLSIRQPDCKRFVKL